MPATRLIIANEAHAATFAAALRARSFTADVQPSRTKFIVATDAALPVARDIFTQSVPQTTRGKCRNMVEATALTRALKALGYTGLVKHAGTKTFPYTVETPAPRAVLRLAFRQSADAPEQERGASCATQGEVDALVTVLKRDGFTARVEKPKTARANFSVFTNAPRATLRALMRQSLDAYYEAMISKSVSERASSNARKCNGCGADLLQRDTGFCADCVSHSVAENDKQSQSMGR